MDINKIHPIHLGYTCSSPCVRADGSFRLRDFSPRPPFLEGQTVSFGHLSPASQRHDAREEAQLIDVDEQDGHGRVRAEDTDGRERGDAADAERESVGERGDRDGHARVAERQRHPFRVTRVDGRLAPRRQQDEHVVDADC